MVDSHGIMNFTSGDLALQLLDMPVELFNPYRILIMSEINVAGGAEFVQLKHDLKMSDGNLLAHLRVLAREGYVKLERESMGKRTRSTFIMTSKGKSAFDRFKSCMIQALNVSGSK